MLAGFVYRRDIRRPLVSKLNRNDGRRPIFYRAATSAHGHLLLPSRRFGRDQIIDIKPAIPSRG